MLIGSSKMSVAPASFSAGISVLIVRFSTTDSIAKPPLASSLTVGDLAARQHGEHRFEGSVVDVQLDQHLAARLQRPDEQRHQLVHRVALGRDPRSALLATISV